MRTKARGFIKLHGRKRVTGVSVGKLRVEFFDLWTGRYGLGRDSFSWELPRSEPLATPAASENRSDAKKGPA